MIQPTTDFTPFFNTDMTFGADTNEFCIDKQVLNHRDKFTEKRWMCSMIRARIVEL